MPYHKITLDKIKNEFGLQVIKEDLFSQIKNYSIDEDFKQSLADGIELATFVNTEKARSEFIVAPVLMKLRNCLDKKIGIFSGTELNIDKSKGLNGVCDFIITKDNKYYFLEEPIVTIVEAKNDNIGYGLAQCMAEMYAALLYNQQQKNAIDFIYGIVTTGSEWKFLQLTENIIIIDSKEYFISELEKLFGILVYIVTEA